MTAVVRDTEDADVTEAMYERPESGLTPRVLGAVALIGLVLTAVLYWRGFRWSAPLVPSVLSGLTGFLVIWLAAAVAVELVHRHHRVMARHGLRLGRNGMLAGARYGGQGWRAVTATAARRWAARAGEPPDGVAVLSPAPAEAIAEAPLPEAAPAASGTQPIGDRPMETAQAPTRADRIPARGTPAVWRQVAAAIADYEPETHEELLAWMAGEVAGVSALAEAYLTVYEHCRDVRKLDEAAIGALEHTSDAAMDCMTSLAYARQRYAQVYEPVAEVAEEHDLPVDARGFFGTGEA